MKIMKKVRNNMVTIYRKYADGSTIFVILWIEKDIGNDKILDRKTMCG